MAEFFAFACGLPRRLCRLAMTGKTTNIRLFLWLATNLALPNSCNDERKTTHAKLTCNDEQKRFMWRKDEQTNFVILSLLKKGNPATCKA